MKNFCKTKTKFVFKYLLVLSAAIFFCTACRTSSPTAATQATPVQKNIYDKSLVVKNKKIFVRVVSTQQDMEQGLSGREKLTDEQGMLFDFKTPQPVSFWMKDMKFNLDLIWINNKKILGITDNVPAPKSPNEKLPTYSPAQNVDMVLEVSAGWAGRYGVKVGDEININAE